MNNQNKATVLIAEDEEINYQYLRALLRSITLDIKRAKNGSEAILMCKQNPDIKLVLMDIGMPIIDGFQATREIKKIRPSLPVIVQTAYTMPEDKDKASEAGCDAHITKPIKRDAFLKLITPYLGLSE